MRARILASLALPLALTAPAAQSTEEEAQFLRHVAEQYLLAQFEGQRSSGATYRLSVEAGRVDSNRDYKGRCNGYLTADLMGREIKTRSIVRITCREPGNAYSLSVPVTVRKEILAVLSSRGIPKGTTITADDLREEWINSRDAAASAVSDRQALIGTRTRRDIRPGEQIRQSYLCLVTKGEKVVIEARKGNMALKTTGIALDDGNLNDTISVKNQKSGKIISAVVTAPGTVSVLL